MRELPWSAPCRVSGYVQSLCEDTYSVDQRGDNSLVNAGTRLCGDRQLLAVEEDTVGGELNSDVVGKMEVELAKLQHGSDK